MAGQVLIALASETAHAADAYTFCALVSPDGVSLQCISPGAGASASLPIEPVE